MSDLSFEVAKLDCKSVTVYSDRAEVKRSLSTELESGQNEILVRGISENVDTESFRVDGRGEATVCDVQFQVIPAKKDDSLADKEKVLNNQIKELEDQKREVQNQKKRLEMRAKMWEKAMERIQIGETDQHGKERLVIDSAKALTEFGQSMDNEQSDIDSKTSELNKKLENLDEEIRVLRRQLNEGRGNQHSIRQLSILLEAPKPTKIELDISYLVSQASWTPDYDIRVFTEGDSRTLKVSYSGLIRQRTGEDWNEAKIELSTAKPSIGGQAPEPRPVKAEFYKKPAPPPRAATKRMMMFGGGEKAEKTMMRSYAMAESSYFQDMGEMHVEQLTVKENIMSATFEIARSTTIPSDNFEHKVSVCQLDFTPKFSYKCLPKQTEYVYLIGKIINNSVYAFLPGKAMVFVNGNFLAKTEMKSVSPGEEFTCSLGADPAIRVTYKPVKKYAEETGLLSKNTVTYYDQRIEIKNTRQESIKLDLVEPIPVSTDEKLKVTLMKPEIAEAKHNRKSSIIDSNEPYLDKDHVLHMNVSLDKGEEKVVEIKYKVDHPAAETVVFNEI